jgi:hypothetical protein
MHVIKSSIVVSVYREVVSSRFLRVALPPTMASKDMKDVKVQTESGVE